MLAIATHSFAKASHTFIRAHARDLAPGQTALIGPPGSGIEEAGCPHLTLSPPSAMQEFLYFLSGNVLRRNHNRSRLSRADRDRVIWFLKEHRAKVLLAEFGHVGMEFVAAARLADVPLYVHFHGFDATVLGRMRRFRQPYQGLFHAASGIIVTTQFMKEQLSALGCPPEKSFVNPIGVSTEQFAPSGADKTEKRVLFVARLVPRKGPVLAVEIFAKVLKDHPDAVLDMIGEGPLMPDLRETVASLGLSDRVRIHGPQSHDVVREHLDRASVLVQHCITAPSGDVEAYGLSIIEAMACAVPVVVTRHGGMTETVAHGETGFLVEEYDTDGAAAAISQLLENPDQAAAMGAAGRQRVLDLYGETQSISRLRAYLGLQVS